MTQESRICRRKLRKSAPCPFPGGSSSRSLPGPWCFCDATRHFFVLSCVCTYIQNVFICKGLGIRGQALSLRLNYCLLCPFTAIQQYLGTYCSSSGVWSGSSVTGEVVLRELFPVASLRCLVLAAGEKRRRCPRRLTSQKPFVGEAGGGIALQHGRTLGFRVPYGVVLREYRTREHW